MKFGVSLALLLTIVFLVTFKFIRKRARLSTSLFAGCSASLLVLFTVVILNFLRADDWKFFIGLSLLVLIFAILSLEFLLRLYQHFESKLALTSEQNNFGNDGIQLKAAAFYNSFAYVSQLESAKRDHFLTKDFWEELTKYRTEGMFKRDKDQAITGNRDWKSKYINVIDGIRHTPNQPTNFDQKLYLFGGSTIFSYEVQDDKTPSAFLQKQLLDSGSKYKVENHGVGGATIKDCLRRMQAIEMQSGDVVVVLFGDNDIGINSPRKLVGKSVFKRIPLWGELLAVFRNRSRITDWLYLETVEFVYTDLKANPNLLNRTVKTYHQIVEFLQTINVQTVFVLQPNLYTKNVHTSFEVWLKDTYPKHWENVVLDGYLVLKDALGADKNFEFLTDIFDDSDFSNYLDWAHLNSEGNEVIAMKILQILSDRRIIGDSTKAPVLRAKSEKGN